MSWRGGMSASSVKRAAGGLDMSHKLSAISFGIVLVAMAPFLAGENIQEELKQAQLTNTEHVAFAPGGTIHLNNTYGEVIVEGWDHPEVEITVVKSMRFGLMPSDETTKHLESIRIATERRSDTELAITTTLPTRAKRFLLLPRNTKAGVTLEYQIHVPSDSRLSIHHGTGMVSVTGVSGDLDATVGRGDIMLWLKPASYSIDAKVKFGHVSSEFEGDALSQYLIGQRFTHGESTATHRLHLRMGFGGITILAINQESEAPAAAAVGK